MSALTKVFVVLHVVVSLLLVAGMVVFVNKVEDFSKAEKSARADADLKSRALAAVELKSQQIVAEKEAAVVEAARAARELSDANHVLENSIAGLQTQVATATADKSAIDTKLTTVTNALQESQKTIGAEEQVNAGLRTRGDDVEKKYTESQVALSDLNNRLDSLTRELNYSKEQNVALTTELEAMRKQVVTGPVRAPAPGAPAGPAGVGPSAIPVPLTNATIRGVVKNKFQVGEVAYATVSVGSADSVSKGTKFNVTDSSGQQFLGYLTIDSVNPNEASGHLNGPNVQAIQKGSEVVSNWQ